jgi:opacity protein-like surface antigen
MSPIGKPAILIAAFCFCAVCLTPFKTQAADPTTHTTPQTCPVLPITEEIQPSQTNDSGTAFDLGFNLSAAYGRRILPWLRGEVESGWMQITESDLKPDSRVTGLNDQDESRNLCRMVNLLADFSTDSEFRPFVGLGLGLTKSVMESQYLGPGAESRIASNGNDISLAYQAMLGVMWKAAPHWGLELRGRYLDGNQFDHHGYAAGAASALDAGKDQFWVVDVGISFNF